jgi:tetratricopeptide (TPR) repeat protein
MLRKYNFVQYLLIIVCILSLVSCGNDLRGRLEYIKNNLIETNHHAEAIVELKKIMIENPDFQDGEINSSILLLDCYQALGDFEEAGKAYVKARDIYNKLESFPVLYGFTYNGLVYMRYYNKKYQITNAKRQIDHVYKLNWHDIFEMKTVENYDIYLNAYIRTGVDNLMNIMAAKVINKITNYKNEEDFYKNLDAYYFKPVFDVFLDYSNSSILLHTIADIINYKFEDGRFLSDLVWNRKEILMKYFSIFKSKGILKKNDLGNLRKYLYRDNFPKEFLEIWNSTFK